MSRIFAYEHPFKFLLVGSIALLFSVGLFSEIDYLRIPATYDEFIYDAIAHGLASGQGYKVVFDSNFVERYHRFGPIVPETVRFFESLVSSGPTAVYPPLYPALLALTEMAFGREIFWPRLLTAACSALGVLILLLTALRFGSFIAMVTLALLLRADRELLGLSSLLVTEPLAFLFLTLLISLALSTRRRTISLYCAVGVITGALILTRSVFIFWLPLIPFAVSQEAKPRTREIGAFLLASLILITPWFFRNIQLLNGPYPLGSQSGIVLGAVYNQNTIENRGNWTLVEQHRYLERLRPEELPSSLRERVIAQAGSQVLREWIIKNWRSIPALLFSRAQSIFIDGSPFQRNLQFAFLLALPLLEKRIRAALVILYLSAFIAIIVTYNAPYFDMRGRLLFPFHPILELGIALAVGRSALLVRPFLPLKRIKTAHSS